jgi:signal transduction histidine kinase
VQRTVAIDGLEVQAEVMLPDGRLAPEVETTVYRVVQESLSNVVKHARAASVDLAVRCDGHEVTISVADDGIGFDPDGAVASGFGLTGMRERVELAGGELSVQPGPQAGIAIRARLPLR